MTLQGRKIRRRNRLPVEQQPCSGLQIVQAGHQQFPGVGIGSFDHLPNSDIDLACGRLGIVTGAKRGCIAKPLLLLFLKNSLPDLFAHAEARHALAGNLGRLGKIIRSAR